MLVLLNALQAGNRSGTGRYTTELARWLPSLAQDLDVAVLWPAGLSQPNSTSETREAFLNREAANPLKRIYMDQVGIRKESAHIKADIVHYPASIGALLPASNAVVTVHDLSFLHESRWFRPGRAVYYRFAVGRSARLAKRVIADSKATANDLVEFLDIPEERIDVIPLGVDQAYHPPSPEAIEAVRAKYDLPEQFFLFVGTLEPRKNLARLIAAWSHIADTCPQDLVLAGRNGWKVAPIMDAIADSPYSERIHQPGFIAPTDLPALMGAAETFVWPSLCEGFGLPPLEAMACGTPVLTSNVSSLPEVVGDAAYMANPYHVDDIAEGMLRLAEESPLRDTLRAKGLERAKFFSWRRTAEATLETYRAVLAG